MNFYIGQRVKVVRCYNELLMEFIGAETTIIGRRHSEWLLSLEKFHGNCSAPNDCLEPILPPGLESPAEIAALYEPEPIELVYSASDGFQPGEV